ncbi:hypothetical protein [Sphingobacterium sp. SYP-B4668]|uniref:hypothetical protein n=1 Tax=Sphingobacterium sp. SYP-B4668 TaxID=2996035 RepID=UPI0022DDDA07|nr:hypothetical protein [Sphingobacterium sp. SYP-B4668]
MNNLQHQTKQAFLFSLAFYCATLLSKVFQIGIFPILMSISLLLSLLWVVLVLREIMISVRISNGERLGMLLLVVFLNVIGGLIYFYLLRERVIGKK